MKIYQHDCILTDEEYNKAVVKKSLEIKGDNYMPLNYFVMNHTCAKCTLDDELSSSIVNSFKKEQVVYSDDEIEFDFDHRPTTNIEVVNKRSFEAANSYKGKKIAILDFANATHPGGDAWSAGAQEESLCRCSTLQSCLFLSKPLYYDKHKNLDWWGTDDLLYVPDVVVFKTDESAPKMLPKEQRYTVDIIVSAAPYFDRGECFGLIEYHMGMTSRIRKILEIAQKNGVEVLILGAYGCGAFKNPPEIIADIFKGLLKYYYFPRVEFAIAGHTKNQNFDIFKKVIESK